jgi:hypothetical protein
VSSWAWISSQRAFCALDRRRQLCIAPHQRGHEFAIGIQRRIAEPLRERRLFRLPVGELPLEPIGFLLEPAPFRLLLFFRSPLTLALRGFFRRRRRRRDATCGQRG